MRRAVVVLGSTAAGLAALFSYKTHVPGLPLASTAPVTPTVSASGTNPTGGASPGASAAKSATGKATSKASASKTAAGTKTTSKGTTTTPTKSSPTTATSTAGNSGGGTSGGGSTATATPTTGAPTNSASATPTATKTTAPAKPSGTFTGSNVSTAYGAVQVQITVSNGKITNATDLQQPQDSISQNAVAQLNQEAISASSANIQAVSGATYTSQGYISSLQSAVSQAGI
jgi:uncharacterized protein with FMN-binding domain